ncbi:MAG: hypothetical protein F6J93_09785 [Oscillatoria sp. SIO1A7]|nr:hypothetical protein [Oscillatoria sp. SIO1A7]
MPNANMPNAIHPPTPSQEGEVAQCENAQFRSSQFSIQNSKLKTQNFFLANAVDRRIFGINQKDIPFYI